MRASCPRQMRGFGLVLLVLAIAALLTAYLVYSALSSVSKRVDSNAGNITAFKAVDDALLRFVMTYKRLPCPASGTLQTGLEDPQGNPADPTVGPAACNSPAGVVPWATLGLSASDALDAWGHFISYRVYAGFTVTNGLSLENCLDEEVPTVYLMSGPGGTCNKNTHENTISDFFVNKGLTVNDRGVAQAKVAYVLISAGATGNGAYYPHATAPLAAPPAASKELLNAGSAGTYWILIPSDPSIPATDVNHFDDVVSYASASNIVKSAHLPRPWPLSAVFNQASFGLSGNNWTTNLATYKVTPTGGPVMLTAAGDTARSVCVLNEDVQGASVCTSAGGNDTITQTGNERLTLDFRVTRRVLKVKLTEFRVDDSTGIPEQARFIFFNGTTLVYLIEKLACHTGSHGSDALAQFRIAPVNAITHQPIDFTKVEIWGANAASDFAVASAAACKADDAICSSTPPDPADCP